MASFIAYDLGFLVLFTIVTIIFFYKNKQNVKRHGWMFLYHSKFGLKFIDWTAKTFSGILRPLQYVVIASGYILMASVVWLLGLSAWRYVTTAIPDQLANVPPIAPLIPYFPKLFNLESFFPPLYFTYFLIALAIVAVSHEFAHGIYARLYKIKVKTTGLAFLGPFFGAFVEPDEKQMYNKPKVQQMSILAAGTFANVVMTVLFALLLWGFFASAYHPAGINFNTYSQALINTTDISSINGQDFDDLNEISDLLKENELNEISVNGESFFIPSRTLSLAIEGDYEQLVVYEDTPASRNKIQSPILEIDGEVVDSHEKLKEVLGSKNPGDSVEIEYLAGEVRESKEIRLAEREGKAFLGVGFINGAQGGFSGLMYSAISQIRDPVVYYEASGNPDFTVFVYDLLWWIVVINILVALFNMLPVSILDGGRFFYLTVWGITGREKVGKKAYDIATWAILGLLVVMMIRWLFVFIK